jgi:hypothetical protein
MRASCRNVRVVVTGCAADYHLHMPETDPPRYRLVERADSGRRVQWLAGDATCSAVIVAAGYRGADPPAVLTGPRVESRGGGAWKIASREGAFEFSARAVDTIEMRPGLFGALHRPFALSARERLAARCLLALLRLPGGARLLRNWHAKRST